MRVVGGSPEKSFRMFFFKNYKLDVKHKLRIREKFFIERSCVSYIYIYTQCVSIFLRGQIMNSMFFKHA